MRYHKRVTIDGAENGYVVRAEYIDNQTGLPISEPSFDEEPTTSVYIDVENLISDFTEEFRKVEW